MPKIRQDRKGKKCIQLQYAVLKANLPRARRSRAKLLDPLRLESRKIGFESSRKFRRSRNREFESPIFPAREPERVEQFREWSRVRGEFAFDFFGGAHVRSGIFGREPSPMRAVLLSGLKTPQSTRVPPDFDQKELENLICPYFGAK